MYTEIHFIDPDSVSCIVTFKDPGDDETRPQYYEIIFKASNYPPVMVEKGTPIAAQVEDLIALLNARHGTKKSGIDVTARRGFHGSIPPGDFVSAIGKPE